MNTESVTAAVSSVITIKVDGAEFKLTVNAARALMRELVEIFGSIDPKPVKTTNPLSAEDISDRFRREQPIKSEPKESENPWRVTVNPLMPTLGVPLIRQEQITCTLSLSPFSIATFCPPSSWPPL